MGQIIPEDYPLSLCRNEAERSVVEIFRDQLSDDWLILPNVGIHQERDYEIDAVLIHHRFGIIDIEVKGHRMTVSNRNGIPKAVVNELKLRHLAKDPVDPHDIRWLSLNQLSATVSENPRGRRGIVSRQSVCTRAGRYREHVVARVVCLGLAMPVWAVARFGVCVVVVW